MKVSLGTSLSYFVPLNFGIPSIQLFHDSIKMVKKVIMNLDLSKVSDPDCVPVVVIKNCEPGLLYILAH